MKRFYLVTSGLFMTAVLVVVWWYYGPGISEATALKFANEYVQSFARENMIDLNSYKAPGRSDTVGRLYTFSWLEKSNGVPLIVTVDSRDTEVRIIESPTFHKLVQ
jgi:hypothetical protein